MSLIKPFRAIYYNPELIKDFSKVVCPPYDITDKKQDRLFKRMSPYNFCNVLKVDTKHNYSYLAHTFEEWIDKGILIEDKSPHIYLYEQKFSFEKKINRRVGFLGLLRIDKKGVVFPHEYTFGAPKKDRYYVIKELKANLSPIFIIVPGKIDALGSSYDSYKNKKSLIEFTDFSGIRNKVWRIDNENMIRRIKDVFKRRHLFIADGHHRFEVAYRYFKKMGKKVKDANYILAYFTDSYNGLLVLPTHRVVKINMPFPGFLNKLSKYFDITEHDEPYFRRFFKEDSKEGVTFGLYNGRKFYLLQLKNRRFLDKIFTKGENDAYKKLDVYILHKTVLSNINKEEVIYTHSIDEAMKLSGKGKVSFILRPTPLKNVFSMANKGFRLPQKSTYFYPKLLSGMIARRIGL